jgi:integral membrane protein
MIGMIEGISLLLLFFFAMPMKYIMGMPIFVRVLGLAHGVAFLLYIYYSFLVAKEASWIFTKTTWKVLLASLIPCGTFYIDKTVFEPM